MTGERGLRATQAIAGGDAVRIEAIGLGVVSRGALEVAACKRVVSKFNVGAGEHATLFLHRLHAVYGAGFLRPCGGCRSAGRGRRSLAARARLQSAGGQEERGKQQGRGSGAHRVAVQGILSPAVREGRLGSARVRVAQDRSGAAAGVHGTCRGSGKHRRKPDRAPPASAALTAGFQTPSRDLPRSRGE